MTDPVTGRTSMPWVFCGGDAATGPVSVIGAVAGGEHAAVAIDEYLSGQNHAFWRTEQIIDTAFDVNADPVSYPRVKMPVLETDRRKSNFNEIEAPWIEVETVRQAKRCLRCDYGKAVIEERS